MLSRLLKPKNPAPPVHDEEKPALYDPETSRYRIPRQAFIDNFFCTPTKKNIEAGGITEEDVKDIYEELEEEKREQQYWRKLEKDEELRDKLLEDLIAHGLDEAVFRNLDFERVAESLLAQTLPIISDSYDQIGGCGDEELRFSPLHRGQLPEIACSARFVARNEQPWNEASEELVIESSILSDGSLRSSFISLKFDGSEYLVRLSDGGGYPSATVKAAESSDEKPIELDILDATIGSTLAQRKQARAEEKERRNRSYLESKTKESEQTKRSVDRLRRALKKFPTKQ